MIARLRKVSDNLYRGGAPSANDILFLNKKLGVKKIVSLDEETGKKIDRATKLLGMKHVMLPINISKKSSLIKFLSHDIPKLFDEEGPSFVHCAQGKDRTGLAVALYRCEEQGWPCEKAIKEAKDLGFGVGIDPKVVNLYMKVIKKACGCEDKKDINSVYDIVSNEREDTTGISGDYESRLSWSPYEDYRIREFPYAKQEIDWPEQYESRQDFGLDDKIDNYNHGFPQSGGWDTSTNGIMGAGPSMVGSGYV